MAPVTQRSNSAAQRLDEPLPTRRSRRLLQRHRRLMQHLGQHVVHHRVHLTATGARRAPPGGPRCRSSSVCRSSSRRGRAGPRRSAPPPRHAPRPGNARPPAGRCRCAPATSPRRPSRARSACSVRSSMSSRSIPSTNATAGSTLRGTLDVDDHQGPTSAVGRVAGARDRRDHLDVEYGEGRIPSTEARRRPRSSAPASPDIPTPSPPTRRASTGPGPTVRLATTTWARPHRGRRGRPPCPPPSRPPPPPAPVVRRGEPPSLDVASSTATCDKRRGALGDGGRGADLPPGLHGVAEQRRQHGPDGRSRPRPARAARRTWPRTSVSPSTSNAAPPPPRRGGWSWRRRTAASGVLRATSTVVPAHGGQEFLEIGHALVEALHHGVQLGAHDRSTGPRPRPGSPGPAALASAFPRPPPAPPPVRAGRGDLLCARDQRR